jgi:hypothetical protein
MLMRRLTASGQPLLTLTTILANIVVIAGLPIAYLTYVEANRAERVQRSLELVTNFNTGDMLAARNLIYRSWRNVVLPADDVALPREVVNGLVERVIAASQGDDAGLDVGTALVNVVTYLDGAHICADREVCDRETLRLQIGPYASTFHCLYQGFIQARRRSLRLPNFGVGVEKLGETKGGCGGSVQVPKTDLQVR